MSEATELARRLEDLAQRLRKRTDEFKRTGGFAVVRRRFNERVETSSDDLRAKVEAAARRGDSWEFTRTEFRRDYEALVNDLLALDARLDAAMMKEL